MSAVADKLREAADTIELLEAALAATLRELEYAYEGDEETARQHGVMEVVRQAHRALAQVRGQ